MKSTNEDHFQASAMVSHTKYNCKGKRHSSPSKLLVHKVNWHKPSKVRQRINNRCWGELPWAGIPVLTFEEFTEEDITHRKKGCQTSRTSIRTVVPCWKVQNIHFDNSPFIILNNRLWTLFLFYQRSFLAQNPTSLLDFERFSDFPDIMVSFFEGTEICIKMISSRSGVALLETIERLCIVDKKNCRSHKVIITTGRLP